MCLCILVWRLEPISLWESVGSAYIRLFYSYCFSSGDTMQLSATEQYMSENLANFTVLNKHIYIYLNGFTRGDSGKYWAKCCCMMTSSCFCYVLLILESFLTPHFLNRKLHDRKNVLLMLMRSKLKASSFWLTGSNDSLAQPINTAKKLDRGYPKRKSFLSLRNCNSLITEWEKKT